MNDKKKKTAQRKGLSPRDNSALLLSIQPIHANRIFHREKLYELRKSLPKSPFTRVYLYESGGGGIVGCFDAGKVIKKPIKQLWREVGERATPKNRFFRYFGEWKIGNAIEVKEPVKFPAPLSLAKLRADFSFRPPQGFQLLEPGTPLYKLLEEHREDAIPLKLHPLKKSKAKEESYRELARMIANNYSEIDDTFADANLKSHFAGKDPVGIFTLKKIIYEALYKGTPIGFATLTLKQGGSGKTGPTLLLEKHRHEGKGSLIREALVREAQRLGLRKLYCTCSDNTKSRDVFNYLRKAGYTVEAHLDRHYSLDHGEYVLGKLMNFGSIQPTLSPRVSKSARVEPLINISQTTSLTEEFHSLLSHFWAPVDKSFATKLIKAGLAQRKGYQEKPIDVLTLISNKRCVAASLLVIKRGGAVKMTFLSSTSHTPSLEKLFSSSEELALSRKRRKIYLLHPLNDGKVIAIARNRGYRTEGILREPYQPGLDCVVLSKSLDVT